MDLLLVIFWGVKLYDEFVDRCGFDVLNVMVDIVYVDFCEGLMWCGY